MTTLTVPLSRIEGHAHVTISFSGPMVHWARFEAAELRGFEYLVQGAPAEQMPVLVPRICGVCSTAHHLAAVKALETIYDVTPPPEAIKIRELMMLGQLIQNQATSLFLFTMPDLTGGQSDRGVRSVFDFGPDDAELAPQSLEVRKAGTDLITLAGGQFIHPVKAVVGGVTAGLDEEAAAGVRANLDLQLPVAEALVERYWDMFLRLKDRIGTLGDDEPTYYLAAVDPGHAYYGRCIRVLSPEGVEEACFDACDYTRYLEEVPLETSYANATLYRGERLRTNSLARLNILPELGTPRAQRWMDRFRETWGHPAHAILLFDLGRCIELVYSMERAMEILDEDGLTGSPGRFQVGHTPRDGEGCGLVEAPRGPLIHHYGIQDGLITKARFLNPTQHSMFAIEYALEVAARRYITEQGISAELEAAVGRVVRAFDPCIACATH
ncbi:MAG: Ni/Fe hydrogenase subunit alpha [Chloroflexi bacterium]|nr:Ni/Fe hydrogenase subunit alpha [Chloroflexota bacterium]